MYHFCPPSQRNCGRGILHYPRSVLPSVRLKLFHPCRLKGFWDCPVEIHQWAWSPISTNETGNTWSYAYAFIYDWLQQLFAPRLGLPFFSCQRRFLFFLDFVQHAPPQCLMVCPILKMGVAVEIYTVNLKKIIRNFGYG